MLERKRKKINIYNLIVKDKTSTCHLIVTLTYTLEDRVSNRDIHKLIEREDSLIGPRDGSEKGTRFNL